MHRFLKGLHALAWLLGKGWEALARGQSLSVCRSCCSREFITNCSDFRSAERAGRWWRKRWKEDNARGNKLFTLQRSLGALQVIHEQSGEERAQRLSSCNTCAHLSPAGFCAGSRSLSPGNSRLLHAPQVLREIRGRGALGGREGRGGCARADMQSSLAANVSSRRWQPGTQAPQGARKA